MKKQILLLLLSLASLTGFAQTYDTKPVDALPYGNQLYKRANNDIIAGLGSAKFRTLDTKQRVDSLLFLKANSTQITYATPQQYGAVGNGVADDTEALRLCFANNLTIRLFGTYLITDSVVIRDNQKIYSDNAFINFNTTTKTALVADDADYWSIGGKLTISGAGKLNNTAIGLRLIKCNSFSVSGVTVKNIAGIGIQLLPKIVASKEIAGGNIIDCILTNNYTGFKANNAGIGNSGAEYCTITNINANLNTVAFDIRPGNVSIVGGSIKYNGTGIKLVGGEGNDSHGIISGVNINHNTVQNVHAIGVLLGETFSGCHLYGDSTAGIRLENSYAIEFIGCQIDGKMESVGLVGNNYLKASMLAPDFKLINPNGLLRVTDCFTLTGGAYQNNLEFFDNNNNVGFGTYTPYSKLHVKTSENFGEIALGHDTYPALISSNAASGEMRLDNRSAGSAGFISFIPNSLSATNGTEAMRVSAFGTNITSSGAVLALTSTNDNGNNYIEFRNKNSTVTGYIGQGSPGSNDLTYVIPTSNVHKFFTSNTERLAIKDASIIVAPNVKLGVGTQTPSVPLEVVGDAKINGNVTASAAILPSQLATLAQAGYSQVSSASGTGSLTQIVINHAIPNVSAISSVIMVQARNAASANIQYVSIDATKIYINYSVAPVAGTSNLLYSIYIKP